MNKIIVNFAPTGLIPTKKDSPNVPISKDEIVEQVHEAYEMGITMVHLHARNLKSQVPVYEKEYYGSIISSIRSYAKDLVICVSTSGRTFSEFEKRSDVLHLEGIEKPDMASLTLSSLNFNNQASINEPDMIKSLAKTMLGKRIKPELEVFDLGMVNYANYLIKKELLKPPYYFNIILGNIACAQSDLLHIGTILKELPQPSVFSLGGVGQFQLQTNSLAISMGYGVRVGLEDNIWLDEERTKLATNKQLIERLKCISDANQKEFMRPYELRKLLDLNLKFGESDTLK